MHPFGLFLQKLKINLKKEGLDIFLLFPCEKKLNFVRKKKKFFDWDRRVIGASMALRGSTEKIYKYHPFIFIILW